MTANAIRALQTALAAKRSQGAQVANAFAAPGEIGRYLQQMAEQRRQAGMQERAAGQADRRLDQGDRRIDQAGAAFDQGVKQYEAGREYQAGRDAVFDQRYADGQEYRAGRDAIKDARYGTEYADSRADRASDVTFRADRAKAADDQFSRSQGHREQMGAANVGIQLSHLARSNRRDAVSDERWSTERKDDASRHAAEMELRRNELSGGSGRSAASSAAAKDYRKLRAELLPTMKADYRNRAQRFDPRTVEAWAAMVESYTAADDPGLEPIPPLPPEVIGTMAIPKKYEATPEKWAKILRTLATYDPVDQAEFIRGWMALPKGGE